MSVDMSDQAITARLRQASRMADPLRPESRLSTKIDLSGAGIAARLREASQLLELCRALAQAGRAADAALSEAGPGKTPQPPSRG